MTDPPPSHAQTTGPGLGAALATYVVTLTAVIVLVALEVGSVRTTLLFDVLVLAVGLALTIAYWPTLGRLLGPPVAIPARIWLISITIIVTTFAIIALVGHLLPDIVRDLMAPYRHEDYGLTFALLQIGPLTAAGEELLFRGVILYGLLAAFPERTAIIVSALMFATIHLSPLNILHTALLGAVYATLVAKTRSLWPAIILHAIWNAAFVLLDA